MQLLLNLNTNNSFVLNLLPFNSTCSTKQFHPNVVPHCESVQAAKLGLWSITTYPVVVILHYQEKIYSIFYELILQENIKE